MISKIGMQNCKMSRDLNPPRCQMTSWIHDVLDSIGGFKSCDISTSWILLVDSSHVILCSFAFRFWIKQASNLKNTAGRNLEDSRRQDMNHSAAELRGYWTNTNIIFSIISVNYAWSGARSCTSLSIIHCNCKINIGSELQ